MSREQKRASIRDVAAMAKTSVSTVSRVMNEADYPVSADLRERVKEAVQRLNYVPNSAARNLRNHTSRDIGVIIPNITNLFYPQTILGIEAALSGSGYHLLLFNTLRSRQRENEYLRMLWERQVKGVIISAVESSIDHIQKYINRGMHFVLLDQRIEGISVPSLNFDSRKGARMAIKYLLERGHRRIILATTPLTRWTRQEIHKGYMEALRAAHIEYNKKLVFISSGESETENTNYEVDAGKSIALDFLESGVSASAIFCVNDMLAFGLINTLSSRGIRVPEDISVIGFDDIPLAEVYLPPLTTIRYPAYETGKLAGMLLLESVNKGTAQMEITMRMDPQFIERNTVKRISPP
jgi:LacI family transcriptional regulator